MYEAAIKRAGLSMNRILFSNTKMLQAGFPQSVKQRYDLSFRYKTFEDGKETSATCKSSIMSEFSVFSVEII